MANNLGSLVVSLGLDAAEFTRGLTKSEYQQQQWARRVETSIEAARTGALASFAAIGTAVAVLDRQLEGIAGFQDLAEKMGDTAQEVASLKLALDVSGTSADTVAAASVKLTAALAKAGDESKGAALGLKAIGLEVDAFKALNPVAQLEAVAQALAGFEDGAGKTAVAVQIFGKSGAELIPMLNDLASGAERQITLTQAQIDGADTYSKATAHLRSEVQQLVQVTAADAAPVMTQMVQMLRDITAYSATAGDGFSLMGALMDGAKVALQTVVILGSDVAFVFKMVGTEIGGMAAQIAALATLDFAGFNAISKAMKEDAARAKAELDRFKKNILNPVTYGADDQSDAEARRLGLSRAPARINISGFATGGGGGASSRTRSTAAAAAPAIRPDLEMDAISADFAALDKQRADRARRAAQITQQTLTPLEKLAATEAELDRLRRDGLITEEVLARARFDAAEAYDATQEKAVAQIKAIADGTDEAKEAAKSLGAAFTSTLNDAFKSGMKFGDLLKKLAFDAINVKVLTPAAQGAGSALASAFTSLVSSYDGGGYTGAGSRSGGLDGRGGFMAMLHPNETVLDHTRGQGASSGLSINQIFNFGNADAATVGQLRAEAQRIKAETLAAVPGVVMAQAGRGGSFAKAVGRA